MADAGMGGALRDFPKTDGHAEIRARKGTGFSCIPQKK